MQQDYTLALGGTLQRVQGYRGMYLSGYSNGIINAIDY